jgi:N-acetylglutamate synthase-like GNAT family acetyltransferase
MEIDTIVVHPNYWRRGHGTNLSQWQLDLADQDQAGMGVAGSAMGKTLFEHLGFKTAETIMVPGYKDHPSVLEVWLGLRDAKTECKPKL